MSSKTKDRIIAALAALALIGFIGVGAWVWTSAPCGFWRWSKAGEMPARCVMK